MKKLMIALVASAAFLITIASFLCASIIVSSSVDFLEILTMSKGETFLEINEVFAMLKPDDVLVLDVSNITDKTLLTWSSADSTIASVDADGNVTGKEVGTTTIYATYKQLTAECRVMVELDKTNINKVTSLSSGTGIGLTWEEVEGASGYVIYRSSTGVDDYKAVKTITKGTTVSYEDKKLKSGTTYFYTIRAYKVVGEETIYSPYCFVKNGAPLKKPSVSATKNGSGEIKVSWKEIAGANGYAVYRATSKNGSYGLVSLANGKGTLHYNDKSTKKDVVYFYKVQAYKEILGERFSGPYSSIYTIGDFLDGSELGKSEKVIVGKLGTASKKYNITDGKILVYNKSYNPITYVIIKENQVIEIYSSDKSEADMNGIKVGSSWDSVSKKLVTKFGSSNVKKDSGKGWITVSTSNHTSIYYFSHGKLEAFRHNAKKIGGKTVDSSFKATAKNETAAAGLIVDLTNAYRYNHGVPYAVKTTTAHNNVAQRYSEYMLANNHFSHTDLRGRQPWDRATAGGIKWGVCGENIAAEEIHPTVIFYQWVHSKGHRDNMLNSAYRKIGVGVAYKAVHGGRNRSYSAYYTQLFTDK